jgi:riboflavin synthase
MFTGIIEGVGQVLSFQGNKKGGKLVIKTSLPLTKPILGESIAIDGCCLTLIEAKNSKLSFDVSDETVHKTIIGSYQKAMIVNLERALKASSRLGGHYVLGHVDSVGEIQALKRREGSLKVTINFPLSLAKYIIEKGSVAVNGISLTACEVGRNKFSVYIIPHTEKLTSLAQSKVGDKVNLEGDVLGKYVERLMLLTGP